MSNYQGFQAVGPYNKVLGGTLSVSDDVDAMLPVGNLDRQVTSDQLHNALQVAAPVVSITVPRHRDAAHGGYAKVCLTSARAAKATTVTCLKLDLEGRRIILWAQSSALCCKSTHANSQM